MTGSQNNGYGARHAVTAQQRQDWDRDGWLLLKDLLPVKARRSLDARAREGDTAARISTIGHFEGRPADEGNG